MFNAPNRSFIAAVDLPIAVRVKLTATLNEVTLAGATDDFIGVTETPRAAGKAVSIRLKNSSGTVRIVAGGAFAYGATVYGVAAGKVDDVPSGNVLAGTALEAALSDGSQVEILLP